MEKIKKTAVFIVSNWFFYLTGFMLIFILKLYYSRAGCVELRWILAPTAVWVRILTGYVFVWEPQAGYVSDTLRFIIAPSCSGVQFMMILMAVFLFSFVHHMRTDREKMLWLWGSIGSSFVCTVLVNGIRIALSVWLPAYGRTWGPYPSWLTPERLHTVIGTAVYFTALLLLYRLAEKVCLVLMGDSGTMLKTWAPPVIWYFLIILLIPVLNRAYRADARGFTHYAELIFLVCLPILLIFFAVSALKGHLTDHTDKYKKTDIKENN